VVSLPVAGSFLAPPVSAADRPNAENSSGALIGQALCRRREVADAPAGALHPISARLKEEAAASTAAVWQRAALWVMPAAGVAEGRLLATMDTADVVAMLGGFASWGMGSIFSGSSAAPSKKTLAWGCATMTRVGGEAGGGTADGVTWLGAGTTPGFGITLVEGLSNTGAGAAIDCWVGGRTGKRGDVLVAGLAPVRVGALGGSWGIAPEGGCDKFGIGLVTAVDQAGGIVCGGNCCVPPGPVICKVVAAEILGRGVILVEAGLSGLGGRLIRRVSRCGCEAFVSLGGGVGGGESAMS
jgi:hypothetical protein